jgi:hypothetical protein
MSLIDWGSISLWWWQELWKDFQTPDSARKVSKSPKTLCLLFSCSCSNNLKPIVYLDFSQFPDSRETCALFAIYNRLVLKASKALGYLWVLCGYLIFEITGSPSSLNFFQIKEVLVAAF